MKKIFKWGGIIVLIIIILIIFSGKKENSTIKPETTNSNIAKTAIYVAIDADPTGYKKAAREAGINFVHRAPTWAGLEPRVGSYDFSDLQTYANLAKDNSAKMNLVFRPIDTGNRSMIEPYNSMAFDDPKMAEAILKMFQTMPPSIKSQVGFLTIGNEVDSYFENHKNEINSYATLLENIIPTLREEFPNIPITVNTTYGGSSFVKSKMRAITDQVDVYSLTYYHIKGDFSIKDPKDVKGVIDNMVKDAGPKKLLIQEIGMPSSTTNGSSEEKQAEFIHNIFTSVREYKGNIVAVTYLWMNDIPQNLVDLLSDYYKLPDNKFKEFLASLGLFTRDGIPKKGWEAFKTEAKLTTQK